MKTFLMQFISDNLNSYVEPVRKGTARGDPVGLSKKKFKAALFSITNFPQKKIARIAETTHGLVRKWRTEKLFMEEVKRLQNEFFRFLVGEIRAKIERDYKALSDYLEGKTDAEPPDAIFWEELNDSKFYGEWIKPLLDREKRKAARSVEKALDPVDAVKQATFFRALRMAGNMGGPGGINNRTHTIFLLSLLEEMGRRLKGTITEEDRRFFSEVVKILRYDLEDRLG